MGPAEKWIRCTRKRKAKDGFLHRGITKQKISDSTHAAHIHKVLPGLGSTLPPIPFHNIPKVNTVHYPIAANSIFMFRNQETIHVISFATTILKPIPFLLLGSRYFQL